ncbi:MAG: ribose-5-phosphate isomerase RpiA [Chitinophagaceae bacterium]
MLSKEEIKKQAAVHAMQYVEDGMTIGIGTGSTVYWFIKELSVRVQQGLNCRCIPTSVPTDNMARQLGIPMLVLNDVEKIDITIDGADEIDPQLNLIKGGGGALLQEKMVAAASDKLIIIADSSKYVKQLGAFPLPVEVVPFGWKQVQQHVQSKYKIDTGLRMKDGEAFITDHGHYILDCHFLHIDSPAPLTVELNMIPGVVENGLFIKMAKLAVVADADGKVQTISSD